MCTYGLAVNMVLIVWTSMMIAELVYCVVLRKCEWTVEAGSKA